MKFYPHLIFENVTTEEAYNNIRTNCMFSIDSTGQENAVFTWVRNRFLMLKQYLVSYRSKSTVIVHTDTQTILREYFLGSQNIPSSAMRQDDRYLDVQPDYWTISESKRWSDWNSGKEEPRFTISFKIVQGSLFQKLPFSYSWSTLDWSYVFSEAGLGSWVGLGYLILRIPSG